MVVSSAPTKMYDVQFPMSTRTNLADSSDRKRHINNTERRPQLRFASHQFSFLNPMIASPGHRNPGPGDTWPGVVGYWCRFRARGVHGMPAGGA
jgi:hypothetical protein